MLAPMLSLAIRNLLVSVDEIPRRIIACCKVWNKLRKVLH